MHAQKLKALSLPFAVLFSLHAVFASAQTTPNSETFAMDDVNWAEFTAKRNQLLKSFGDGREIGRVSYKKLLELTEKTYDKKPIQYAGEMNTIAVRCIVTDLFPEAEESLSKAAEVLHADDSDDGPIYGRILSNLGRLLELVGKFDEAKPILLKAMDLRSGDCRGYAISKGWLGRLYLHAQNFPQAKQTLDEVIAYREKCGSMGAEFIECTDNLNDLAEANLAMNAPEEALRQAQSAIEIRKNVDKVNLIPRLYSPARPLSLAALAHARLKDMSSAQKEMNEAVALADKLPGPDDEVADIYVAAADFNILSGNKAEAQTQLKKAIDIRIALFGKDSRIVQRTEQKLEKI